MFILNSMLMKKENTINGITAVIRFNTKMSDGKKNRKKSSLNRREHISFGGEPQRHEQCFFGHIKSDI